MLLGNLYHHDLQRDRKKPRRWNCLRYTGHGAIDIKALLNQNDGVFCGDYSFTFDEGKKYLSAHSCKGGLDTGQ